MKKIIILLLLIFTIGIATGQGLLGFNQEEITIFCEELYFVQSELFIDAEGDPYYILVDSETAVYWFIYFNKLGYVNISIMIPISKDFYYDWLTEIDGEYWDYIETDHWINYPTLDSSIVIHCTRHAWNLIDPMYETPVFEFNIIINE